MLKIDLFGLKEGINPFDLSFSGDIPLFRQLDVALAGEGSLRGSVDKRGEEFFLLSGSLSVPVTLSCRRCLRAFDEEIRSAVTLVVMRRESRDPGGAEDEDLLYLSPGQREIDLEDLVREHFLLNLPPYPLCSEECRGLCPGCGADLNDENCRCVE